MLIQFQKLSFSPNVQVLMSYFSMNHRGELDPQLFTDFMLVSIPGIRIALPVMVGGQQSLHALLVGNNTQYQPNSFGIDEPINGTPIDHYRIDVVFVPLLAFDKQGYRVGYGKGYYDRFLASCREDVIAIGFSFFEPIDKIEDTDMFDIPLNYCIGPNQLYEF